MKLCFLGLLLAVAQWKTLWSKNIYLDVAYFDQHSCATHAKCWLKYVFLNIFNANKAEKRRKSKKVDFKFSKKQVYIVCTQTLVEVFFSLFFSAIFLFLQVSFSFWPSNWSRFLLTEKRFFTQTKGFTPTNTFSIG